MKAVQIGAGNIGRGFMGQLLFEAGFHTTFVDVQRDLLEQLERAGSYTLHIVGDGARDVAITNFDVCDGANEDDLAKVICNADVAATAVGERAFDAVLRSMAKGVEARILDTDKPPLNVLLCENIPSAAKRARAMLTDVISQDAVREFDERIGLVEASIGRMVPIQKPSDEAGLDVFAEAYDRLPVDGAAIRGDAPELPTLERHDPFQAIIDRKLFVHNMSHAATAYLGYLRGHEFIWQAIGDARVREIVAKAIDESCEALAKAYGSDCAELAAHGADLLRRYANRALGDQVVRVARDPIRKLAQGDRIAGAMRLCLDHGVEPAHISVAAAAGLLYDAPGDDEAEGIQRDRADQGDAHAIERYMDFARGSHANDMIVNALPIVFELRSASESRT